MSNTMLIITICPFFFPYYKFSINQDQLFSFIAGELNSSASALRLCPNCWYWGKETLARLNEVILSSLALAKKKILKKIVH